MNLRSLLLFGSCLVARCASRLISAHRCLNLLVTFGRTLAISLKISRGLIKWLAKLLGFNIAVLELDTIANSWKNSTCLETLVRVIQRTHPSGVPSKLNPKFSGLCEVLEVRGPVLKLRELDSQREFTANHDAVRRSSLQARMMASLRPADDPLLLPDPPLLSQPLDSLSSLQMINNLHWILFVRKPHALYFFFVRRLFAGSVDRFCLFPFSSNDDFTVGVIYNTSSFMVPSSQSTNVAAIDQNPELFNSPNYFSSPSLPFVISEPTSIHSSNFITEMDNIDPHEISLFR